MAEKKRKRSDSSLSHFMSREVKDLLSIDLYRSCAAEFIGMILLNFMACGTALSNPGNPIAVSLEAGFFVGCAIRTLSTVSGGHVNPAISLGFMLLGHITVVRFIFYSIIQTLGAASGTALLKTLAPANVTVDMLGVILPAPGVSDTQALICEMVITFFLLFGTFAMIDPKRDDVNGFAPLQIGFIVVVNIVSTYHLSGGCMNPARTFGPAIVAGKYDRMWIYWVGDMSGAIVGALLYDKVFSTKVSTHFMKRNCWSSKQEEEEPLEEMKKLYVPHLREECIPHLPEEYAPHLGADYKLKYLKEKSVMETERETVC